MTKLLLSLAVILAACGGSDDVCEGDHCVCPPNESCSHDCDSGGLDCNVQCGPGTTCDVGCGAGEDCNVECSQGASCDVDCGASSTCDVTCPANNCTVSNCVQGLCDVTCGLGGLPTRNGNTATCP
jgi:hypothetical protein